MIHRTGDRVTDVNQGRAVAERIPGARFVELPGDDHIPFLGDYDAITNEIEEFLTGAHQAPDTDRVLATVLFTDIVGSTDLRPRSAIGPGGTCWRRTTRWYDVSWRSIAVSRSTRPATASWPGSMAPRGRFVVRKPSLRRCGRSGSRFARACTRVNAR